MGNRSSKSSLRSAIIYLNISADEISVNDDKFWCQIFSEEVSTAEDVIRNITVQEIRMLRDGSPKNFATLAFKMVERLRLATGTLCNTAGQQGAVLIAAKILIRLLPCVFEDPTWRYFFEANSLETTEDSASEHKLKYPEKKQSERNYIAYVPVKSNSRSNTPNELSMGSSLETCRGQNGGTASPMREVPLLDTGVESKDLLGHDETQTINQLDSNEKESIPAERQSLMKTLLLSICDLLFCPEFTVLSHGDSYLGNAVDAPPEDLKSLSTHDYVWEPGVGFDSSVNSTLYYDKNRSELLRSLLVCLSVPLYELPEKSIIVRNNWMEVFVSRENRHALPLFTSLINVVFGFKQTRPILQFNSLLSENNREQLVEVSCQLLIAVLDYNMDGEEEGGQDRKRNSFIDYMSRIHREEDLIFLTRGFVRLLKSGLEQSHSWMSTKAINLDQELQMLLWKICNLNRKFVQFLLNSSDFLDVVVPILYHLNENFQEPSRTALIHIGVFNLLLLSGERNFGVRLNKQYTANLLVRLPDFRGSHADLMILVFHKLIMYGYKINQLYDYLLTILVNVSPYLKGATILASKCLIQLFETFSSVYVIFTEPNYHQLVIFLLEIFNNLIQYQFDGNVNLVYMILTKKETFLNLVNLPTSQKSIDRVLRRLAKQKQRLEQSKAISASELDKNHDNQPCNTTTDKIEETQASTQSLATVSCSSGESSSSKSMAKQEVSLVATPELQHSTQPVRPFISTQDNSAKLTKVDDSTQRIECEPEAKISLDDILNESGSYAVVDLTFNTTQDDGQARSTMEACCKPNVVVSEEDQPPNEALRKNPFNRRVSFSPGSSESGSIPSQAATWSPTSAWLKEWKQNLPLETIHRMICALGPQLDQLQEIRGRSLDELETIKFLQNGTLVGLLPVPHPIQIRKYRTNDASTMWLRACTWGIVFVRSTIWTGTDIKLINIL